MSVTYGGDPERNFFVVWEWSAADSALGGSVFDRKVNARWVTNCDDSEHAIREALRNKSYEGMNAVGVRALAINQNDFNERLSVGLLKSETVHTLLIGEEIYGD